MPRAHGIEQLFARAALAVNHGITDMCGGVIAARFEGETVTFQECEINETFGAPAADGILFGWAARRAGPFIALAAALINFDHRFINRIVVAPVGAHAGG